MSRGLIDSVRLMGSRPSAEMPKYFAVADVLLVTLVRSPIFALTIPSKVQAYLACGRPIVAALDGEGARVVEESGAGLTCAAQSPEQIVDRVRELQSMTEDKRVAMGIAGRIYFERNFALSGLNMRLEKDLRQMSAEYLKCAS